MKKITTSFNTKYGWVTATEQNGRLITLIFSKTKNSEVSNILRKTRLNFKKFFLRKLNNFKIPYIIHGTINQKKVWKEISKIKFGKTKTYGEIAKITKLSPRSVGKICGQNKLLLIIPCHRVIRKDGKLGGFSARGGIKLKKKLLEFENNLH